MAETGVIDMTALGEATRGISGEFDLLDKASLDKLKGEVAAVNQKLEDMAREAEDARQAIADLNVSNA